MPDLLDTIELQTHETPDATVIWLHGLGADGSDFVPVIPEVGLDPSLRLRFVFPNAPAIPVTCNGGMVMPAWYDILRLDPQERQVDLHGIVESRQRIRDLIRRERARGIASERIVLAGFSQGGAIAYTTALTHPEPLAGILALSTYLPVPELVTEEATAANRNLPVFAAHGTEDDVVAIELGRRARDTVRRHGCVCRWREYPLPHSVSLDEIHDIGVWLSDLLATPKPTDS